MTGSSRGIGRAIAEALRAEGCRVAINARNTDGLQACASAIGAAVAIAGDVADAGEARRGVDETVRALGGLDILVCNVGSGISVNPGDENFEEWQKVISNNFYSAVNVIEAAKNELSKSLEYYQKAKLIRESIGDNFGLSGILVNIGNIYRSLGNLDQSIEYYLRGMVIMEELQANNWLPNAYGNCAYAHRNKGEFVESSHYFNKLLDLTNRLDNQSGIANSHFELALNFYYQQDFENSRAELLKAFKIEDESYHLFIGVLNKHKGKDYSKEFELVKEELDTDQELDPRTYYFLNILLDDPSYLQKAYDTMMEVEQYILPEFKESFNSYPIHKLILDAKNIPT